MRGVLVILASAAFVGLSSEAMAQETSAGGRVIYEAAFFQRFSPANALQIVERVPGFNVERSDNEVRGFGQAGGNVVINGQRPATKSDSLETVLSRIPASRVVRIEIASGDRFGAEYTGKAQVVNVVLAAGGGVAGTLEGQSFRDFTGRLHPEATATALFQRGPSTFNVAAKLESGQTSSEGSDVLTTLPDGALFLTREKVDHYRQPWRTLSASWSYDGGENRTAHFNASYKVGTRTLFQESQIIPVSGPDWTDSLTQRNRVRTYEVGGDVTRPFAGGGLKLVGLATRRHRSTFDEQLFNLASPTGGQRQDLENWREESVARLVWSRRNLGGWTVEVGGEGAYNRLQSVVDFFNIDALGGGTRVDLPLDDVTVKETRGEAFLNAGRPLSSTLRMDLGLTYEASRLTVLGDAGSRRTLSFPKPRATFDWRHGAWHAQLSVQRTVAQLNFEEFASSAELANERVNGGNSDLLPQRAWESLLTVDRTVLGDGRIKIDLGYDRISKLQDRVPTPEGLDAPGNLGAGTRLIARTNLDVPLNRFGIKGGRMTFYGSYVDTSVRDPYTGRKRPFSYNSPFYWEASFRQDLGRFAWGANLEGNTASTAFRRDELDRSYSQQPYVEIFAEYRPSARTTFRIGAENITNRKNFRERLFFSPDRTSLDPVRREFRYRSWHVFPSISVKHSFG